MGYALFTEEGLKKRLEILKEVKSPDEDYYPSREDIRMFIKENPEKYIDFLLWLSVREQDFTMDELETKKYVQKLINKTVRIRTQEDIAKIKEFRMKPKKKKEKT